MSVKGRIMIERVIAQRIIAKALAEGLGVSIHNGEDEDEPPVLHNPDEALAQIMQTDMDGLYFYRRDEGRPYAWIRLVYGNDGFDVISDYTTNLEEWLKPIQDWISEIEAQPLKLLELPQEVWVIMSNDFPVGVFNNETDAEALCKANNAADKARAERDGPTARVYWKAHKFTLGEVK